MKVDQSQERNTKPKPSQMKDKLKLTRSDQI